MRSRIQRSFITEHATVSSRILVLVAAALSSCQGFMRNELTMKSYRQYVTERHMRDLLPVQHMNSPSTLLSSSSNLLAAVVCGEPEETNFSQPATSEELIEEVTRLYDNRQIETAMKVLENFQVDESGTATSETTIAGVLRCFKIFLEKLILEDTYFVRTNQWATNMLQTFIDKGTKNPAWLPTSQLFHLVVQSWIVANPSVVGTSVQCKSLIEKQWSVYHQELKRLQQQSESSLNDKDVQQFIPQRDTYFSAIRACSLRDRGVDAAKRAEALMDEMEALREKYPQLTPDRAIMNEVMNAWSKSGLPYRAGKRCETLINRMISMAQDDGCWRMTPDTLSFNIAIAALAQGKERDSGSRAETLLYRMEDLSKTAGWDCVPDRISFNSVINNWASSKSSGAAERAVEIMDHMIKRHEAGVSTVCVDDITYSVVLKALAKSKDNDALDRAEDIFESYRKAVEEERWGLSHNSLTWNSMINCYAKSMRQNAGKKAMELFETMKSNAGKPEWERCCVDKYTYTSLIDAIAKEETYEASEKAISLVEEIEKKYEETANKLLEPNILLYTAVVNAIGRSHKDPDRAQRIVDRVERRYLQEAKGRAPRPDVLFYNALINAYGWSDMEGRSRKSFEVLQHMCDLFQSGEVPDAKPDIISYNSVLNACAHEQTKSQSESDRIMKVVTELYEDLTSASKGRVFARPNQNTYVQVLIAISNHMPPNSDKKSLMGEAVFFKCAEDGHVSPQTIIVLDQILPMSRFHAIMGDALDQELHIAGKLSFDVTKLPWEWTANVRGRNKEFPPTKSRKVKRDFVLNNMPRQRTKSYR